MVVGYGSTRARNGAFLLLMLIIEIVSGMKRHKLCKRMGMMIQAKKFRTCGKEQTGAVCFVEVGVLPHLCLVGHALHNDNLELWSSSRENEERVVTRQETTTQTH